MLKLAFSCNIRGLLIESTDNLFIQTFRALIAGVIAFIADAGLLWLISFTGLHYLICTVFGFLAGIYVNYVLSVKFVFSEKANIGKLGEITVYIVVGAIGLALTAGLMWFFTEVAGIYFIISKVIATVIVFVWNFASRKVMLYRRKAE